MGTLTLSARTLLNQTAAVTTNPFPCDYRNGEGQNRTFSTVLAAADTITIQGTVDPTFTNWFTIGTHNAAGTFSDVFAGPLFAVRVVKVGALGNATVQAIL